MRILSALLLVLLWSFSLPTFAPSCASPGSNRETVGWNKKVTLDLKQVRLRHALVEIYRGTGLRYSVDRGVADVVLDVKAKDEPIRSVLRRVERSIRAKVPAFRIDRDNDLWVFGLQPSPQGEPVKRK